MELNLSRKAKIRLVLRPDRDGNYPFAVLEFVARTTHKYNRHWQLEFPHQITVNTWEFISDSLIEAARLDE